jgi:hypothetical protein
MAAQKVDVRFVPINSVHQWKENPWKHDGGVPSLALYLAINGQKSPVQVWRKNNVIYKGNHTQKALLYLGQHINEIAKELNEPPTIVLGRVNPDEIKVEFTDFPSEEAAVAYGMSDNNSSKGGIYDETMLRQLMLQHESFLNAQRTGFTEKELNAFRLATPEGKVMKLENINLEGGEDQVGEFMIITFDDKEVMNRFKDAFQIPLNERKIDSVKLIESMATEWYAFIAQPSTVEEGKNLGNGDIPF